MKVSAGMTEQGIVVGNVYDKYNSRNPIVRWIMRGFHDALNGLVRDATPDSIHEIGCGEGYLVLQWNRVGLPARGSDFSGRVIELARANALSEKLSEEVFEIRSVYDLEPTRDSADPKQQSIRNRPPAHRTRGCRRWQRFAHGPPAARSVRPGLSRR